MRARYVWLMALVVLAVPYAVMGDGLDADAVHKGGSGHGDGIDVEYTESGFNAITVQLAELPSSQMMFSVISVSDHQTVGPIAAAELFVVDVKELEEGVYTILLTQPSSGATIAECQLTVGKVSYAVYEPSGGSGEMTPGVSENGKITLRQCWFEPPEGKSFKAWSIDGKEYRPGSSVQADSDIIVKAVWKDGSSPDPGSGVDMALVLGAMFAVIIVLLVVIVLILVRRRKRTL